MGGRNTPSPKSAREPWVPCRAVSHITVSRQPSGVGGWLSSGKVTRGSSSAGPCSLMWTLVNYLLVWPVEVLHIYVKNKKSDGLLEPSHASVSVTATSVDSASRGWK